jgi:hypothetical protein
VKHGRRDREHALAGELARECGFTTFDCGDVGDGFPDWVWGRNGLNFMVEIKSGAAAPFQPKQLELATTWRGQWVRADTPQQAVQLALAYVEAFSRVVTVNSCGWNDRPRLSAAEAVAMEKSRAEPRTGSRGYQGPTRGPRRDR